MTKTWRSFGKHHYWPWRMTFHSVFLALSCIFVQRRKYLRWRDVKVFLQDGRRRAFSKSQVGWPLASSAIRGFFLPFTFQIWSKKLYTQHFQSNCSSKNVLFMGKSDLEPCIIDLNLCVNLPIEIPYQYEYVAHMKRLNFLTITTCLRKSSAYRCEIT